MERMMDGKEDVSGIQAELDECQRECSKARQAIKKHQLEVERIRPESSCDKSNEPRSCCCFPWRATLNTKLQ